MSRPYSGAGRALYVHHLCSAGPGQGSPETPHGGAGAMTTLMPGDDVPRQERR